MKTMNSQGSKNVICECDLGHDPDDFFALCYLYSAGINIKAIAIHKGEPHQIAMAKFFCKEVGLDIPVGATSPGMSEPKEYVGEFEGRPVKEYIGFHHKLMQKYGYPTSAKADDFGWKVINDAYEGNEENTEIFIIGPPNNFGEFIGRSHYNLGFIPVNQVTFQGCFIGYDVHGLPCERIGKFEGKRTCPSYNPNGAVDDTLFIAGHDLVKNMRFVSKNVCHTIVYDKSVHEKMKTHAPKNRADELFIEGMELYLQKHSEKKFHDPCAAVCMVHPEIATWVKCRIYRENGEWGAYVDQSSNREIIASIDKDRLWGHLVSKT